MNDILDSLNLTYQIINHKNNCSYGNLLKTGPMTPFAILPIAVFKTGFNSFKISDQFSFKNLFVVSLSNWSPLNKFDSWICIWVVVKSSLTSENCRYSLSFFTFTFGTNFRLMSMLSMEDDEKMISDSKYKIEKTIHLPKVKLAGPFPTMGKRMTLPLILYCPMSDNCFTSA